VIGFLIAFFNFAYKRHKPTGWKSNHNLADDIVWLLYYLSLYWICLPYFPYITWAMPIFFYLLFKYLSLNLRVFKKKSIDTDNSYATGFFLMVIVNITFTLVITYYFVILFMTMTHDSWTSDSTRTCGPLTSGIAAMDMVISTVKNINNTTLYKFL
jgi:hypothetical protein